MKGLAQIITLQRIARQPNKWNNKSSSYNSKKRMQPLKMAVRVTQSRRHWKKTRRWKIRKRRRRISIRGRWRLTNRLWSANSAKGSSPSISTSKRISSSECQSASSQSCWLRWSETWKPRYHISSTSRSQLASVNPAIAHARKSTSTVRQPKSSLASAFIARSAVVSTTSWSKKRGYVRASSSIC